MQATDPGARCRRRSSRSSTRSPASRVRSPCCSARIRWPARWVRTRGRCCIRRATICRRCRRRPTDAGRGRCRGDRCWRRRSRWSSPATACASPRPTSELRALAEAAGLPVATTAAGKGSFAETHPLALGVFGTFGTAAANACIAEADLVLVVGTKLVAMRHGVGKPRSARSDAADLHPDRHRAAQRVVELPGRACAARRRRDRAAAALRRGGGRAGPARRRRPSAGRRLASGNGYFNATAPISPTTRRSCRSA